jgi:nicotinate-nucleotide adenylyltransferase
MSKVGIMGGTFNPIHYGHLFLAEAAYEQLDLDNVLFMPSKNPPHKDKPQMITEQQRVDMIELAIGDNPHFEFSSFELDREGMTYSADTLTLLKEKNPNTEYYFIVGADSLFYMHKWMQPQIIFDLCTVVAASRDNTNQDQLCQQADYLKANYNAKIELIDMPTIQIASAVIRKRVSMGKSVKYYLPDDVYSYIVRNELYTVDPEDMN